jgi:crotonobetainyl-CoA:carnitine CoA-transferase CaiB-like acyl-CoA transferase
VNNRLLKQSDTNAPTLGALDGVRVLDLGMIIAGPMLAALLADFGADVVKVEHPKGDPIRKLGWEKDGVSLWSGHMNRNKRFISLNLSTVRGAELLKELVADVDVLVESFRPGTMERWGLDYETLAAINPGLVMVRTSGFGQTGPRRTEPGFGTAAEAMSGFAHINGYAEGPPTLPPIALGDGMAALYGTIATLIALHHRNVSPERLGQVVDVSLIEPLFAFLGPQALAYDQLGEIQTRTGNSTTWTSPRNVYRARDGRWVAVSASAQSVAERVVALVGRPELAEQPWFKDHAGRHAHEPELHEIIGGWIAERTLEEVLEAFGAAHAVAAPVYSIADIFEDPQYQAREAITTVEDPRLGPVRTTNVVPRLSRTPGRVRHLGKELGADNHAIYVEQLGHDAAELEQWRDEGVI